MLASELREIATKVSNANLNSTIDYATEYLENLALAEAKHGAFIVKIPLHKIPFAKDVLTKTFIPLQNRGYVCNIDSEITVWYSNTDYDSEDVLIMKW